MKTDSAVSKDDMQKRRNDLRAFHQPLLDAIGDPKAYVVGKMKMESEGKPAIWLFFTELDKGDPIYIELTSRELIPETEARTLYKLEHRIDWRTAYKEVSGKDACLVPLSEFKEVQLPKRNFSLPLPDSQDAPMSEMTIRDYTAIHTGTPVSLKPWLNDLVISIIRNGEL